MNYVLVGIGGALGGLSRYQLGKILLRHARTSFPIGTFLVNVSGALLLGVLTSMEAGDKLYLLFGDGFCGAFTTFSTFMYEGFHLFQANKKRNALTYIIGTAMLGIIFYVCGFVLGTQFLQ